MIKLAVEHTTMLALAASICFVLSSCGSEHESKLYTVQRRVLSVFAKVLKRPIETLSPSSNLANIYVNDKNPQNKVELKKALEDEFKVTISDDLLKPTSHIYDTIDYIGWKCYGLRPLGAVLPQDEGPAAPRTDTTGDGKKASTADSGSQSGKENQPRTESSAQQ